MRTLEGRPPIWVHALPETLAALRTHIFNGVIWPDFTRLPSAEQPTLALTPIAVGETMLLGGKKIEVLPAAHTVPAVGFGVDGGAAGWWVFTGDTGPNPALWERLQTMNVAHLVIETAFGDDERQLARISRHLCPSALGHELKNLGRQRRGAHHPHQAGRDGRGDGRDRPARLAAPDLGAGGGPDHDPDRRRTGARLRLSRLSGRESPRRVTETRQFRRNPGGSCRDW